MISSTLGLTGMIGYSQYAPTKFALRGLAECLRQELLPQGIAVHVYYVATIDSPGHAQENITKPAITKLIEEGDWSDYSPASRAKTLIQGIAKGHFSISSDLITEVFRCSARGASPGNTFIWDWMLCVLGQAGLAGWRWYSDWLVLQDHDRRQKSN